MSYLPHQAQVQVNKNIIKKGKKKKTLKAYPTPGEVKKIFSSAKMRGKDGLKGTWSNFTPWLRDFEHRCENCWGVVATPLRRTKVKVLVPDKLFLLKSSLRFDKI